MPLNLNINKTKNFTIHVECIQKKINHPVQCRCFKMYLFSIWPILEVLLETMGWWPSARCSDTFLSPDATAGAMGANRGGGWVHRWKEAFFAAYFSVLITITLCLSAASTLIRSWWKEARFRLAESSHYFLLLTSVAHDYSPRCLRRILLDSEAENTQRHGSVLWRTPLKCWRPQQLSANPSQ